MRIRRDAQTQVETRMPVNNFDCRNAWRRQFATVVAQTLDLDPETFSVGDDEAQITDLRHIHTRVIDFVEDAIAGGKPQPWRAERAAHHVLGTARPSRGNTWVAWRVHGCPPVQEAAPSTLMRRLVHCLQDSPFDGVARNAVTLQ